MVMKVLDSPWSHNSSPNDDIGLNGLICCFCYMKIIKICVPQYVTHKKMDEISEMGTSKKTPMFSFFPFIHLLREISGAFHPHVLLRNHKHSVVGPSLTIHKQTGKNKE